ncbi:MAG: ABC transporter ATP-binding protein [Sulfitobacter sp.]
MISLSNVSKSFHYRGKTKVVADKISAEFSTGQSIALLGRNGAGKSSLLKMIAGSMRPDSGQIKIDGAISWPVGFAGSFHQDMTGDQNTLFVARVYGVDTRELRDFVEDFAELGSHFYQPLRSYSAGMKARLAFAVSMGIHFDIYLVDEVSAVGDARFREKSEVVFHDRMRNSGAVVVTHSMAMVRRICDAAAVLENGRLTFYDNINEAILHHERNMRISDGQE